MKRLTRFDISSTLHEGPLCIKMPSKNSGDGAHKPEYYYITDISYKNLMNDDCLD
jgi:hypothetical protein